MKDKWTEWFEKCIDWMNEVDWKKNYSHRVEIKEPAIEKSEGRTLEV
jgi:hypothetical protein